MEEVSANEKYCFECGRKSGINVMNCKCGNSFIGKEEMDSTHGSLVATTTLDFNQIEKDTERKTPADPVTEDELTGVTEEGETKRDMMNSINSPLLL
jgi:hypothetical protein